ncbi:hypothetical protein THAOC_12784 [Thalassiosira oceanica]|uniref:Cyclin N-terminal domain-containing protein n=1 Tax=Thalassiosira oceanica TaxID=159749 RepID=K0SLW0_THAOC|nr:hypothetical protein THAOC_12784 [Thalassiosira oceanica]|eukprot:EJK66305.1 hypothetical protein THAOC_12784 [Thalassiosira oceanica]
MTAMTSDGDGTPDSSKDMMVPQEDDISARKDRCAAMAEKESVYNHESVVQAAGGSRQSRRGQCFVQPSGSAALETPSCYTSDQRQQIISWMFRVVDCLDAHRMPHCKDTMMLQMLATREIKLSRDSFAKVEIELLEVLRWLVHPPSPLQFVEEFLWFVRESALEKCGLTASARWLCEQHVYSGTLAKKPSAVGIAAIVCSIENSQSECKLHRVAAFVRDVQTIPGFEDLFDSDDFHRSRRYFRDLWQLYRTPHDHGVLSLSGPDTTAAVLTRSVIEEDLTRCGSSDMTPQKRTC